MFFRERHIKINDVASEQSNRKLKMEIKMFEDLLTAIYKSYNYFDKD